MEKILNVKQIIVHHSYHSKSSVFIENDIALLELAKEVDLTVYTPACMAKTSDTNTFDGKNAWVYGETVVLLSQ